MPPRTLRIRESLFAFVSLALLAVTALPVVFSFGSAGAAGAIGATGNDPRAFPKTFHIWGGNPSSYTKYDLVIGYPDWDLASQRAANPGATYLVNVMLDPWNPDWRQRKGLAVTYGGASAFAGGTDNVVDGSAANVGTIPAWNTHWDTLHRPDGSVALINSEFGHPGWNLTRTETAEKVAEIEAYGAKLSKLYRNGWDGIWSDNWIYRIGAGWFYGSNLDTNRDGRADDMSLVSRQWWDGLTLVGQRLRTYLPGKIVGGNGAHNVGGWNAIGSDPNGPYKSTNVTMNEVLQFYTSKPDTVVSEVQTYLGFADPHGMARYFLLKHQLPGGQGDYRSMRWGFSLATIAGGYYEPYATWDNDAFSYDEFTGGSTVGKRGWLGQPVTAPTKLSNGVWRRDFQNGIVLNNSTSSAQAVSLGGTYHRLRGSQDSTVNSGAAVTAVTVPAGDGLFLVGAVNSGVAVPQNTALPVISGSPVAGQTLVATNGSWTGSPTSHTYQWMECDSAGMNCANISGATSSSYALTTSDIGSKLRVKVTAANTAGSTTAVSASTSVIAAFVVTQSIADGATLSSTITWSASVTGKSLSKIDFSVDGKVVSTDVSSPFSTVLDTTSLANGTHVFSVSAVATDATAASASASASVSNTPSGPPAVLSVAHNLVTGQKVSGSLLWSATTSGKPASKVEFSVDGSLVGTDLVAPYQVTVDTGLFADGEHSFVVKAFATDGTTAIASASLTVSNTAGGTFSVTQSIKPGQVLSGTVDWVAVPSGPASRVEFFVDGAKVATEFNAPYEAAYDTRKLPDGKHTLGVVAHAAGSGTARSDAEVSVANQASPPGPNPSVSVTQNLASGQTLSGEVSWSALPTGKPIDRVEFVVDGKLSWTERYEPWVYAGDGKELDTRSLANGSHTLSVTAFATDGSTASASASVLVSNSSGVPALTSSVKDGSTITGLVSWTITPNDISVSRMDFYIDDKLMWTERYAPWTYGGDYKKLDAGTLGRGQHTFVVKAYATDGSVEVLTLKVTVG